MTNKKTPTGVKDATAKLPAGKPSGVQSSTSFSPWALENASDLSQELKAPNDAHMHPINANVHPGTAKRSDFDPGGPEVPARNTRERVDPGVANDARRKPLIDVTPIASDHGNSHIAEPPPKAL